MEEFPLIVRLVAASVITYLVIDVVFPGKADMTGALTALLVVQASVMSTIKTAFEKVAAVIIGVSLSVELSNFFGLNVLSLFFVITVALFIGTILDFKDNKLEIPISAMLILSASQHGVASEQRVYNTLIGVAIGLTVAFLFPLKPKLLDAIKEVNTIALNTANNVQELAENVENDPNFFDNNTVSSIQALNLLNDSSKARDAVREARKSMVMNFGNFEERHHRIDLMDAIDSLDNCVILLQKILISLELQSQEITLAGNDSDLKDDLRLIYSSVMSNASYAVKTFGEILDGEDDGDYDNFNYALSRLRGSRAMLIELLTLPSIPDSSTIIIGNVLLSIEGILRELDINEIAEYEVRTKEVMKGYLDNLSEPITRGKLRKQLARNDILRNNYRRIKYARRNGSTKMEVKK